MKTTDGLSSRSQAPPSTTLDEHGGQSLSFPEFDPVQRLNQVLDAPSYQNPTSICQDLLRSHESKVRAMMTTLNSIQARLQNLVPSLLQDFELLETIAAKYAHSVSSLEEALEPIQDDSPVIQDLRRLHTEKTRLELLKQAAADEEEWSAVAKKLETYLEGKDWEHASISIQETRETLRTRQGDLESQSLRGPDIQDNAEAEEEDGGHVKDPAQVADWETALAKIRTRMTELTVFGDAVEKHVLHDLNARRQEDHPSVNSINWTSLYRIFERLDKVESISHAFIRDRSIRLKVAWNACEEAIAFGQKVEQAVREDLLEAQKTFENPLGMVKRVLAEGFGLLSEDLTSFIDSLLKSKEELGWPKVQEFLTSILEVVKRVEVLLEIPEFDELQEVRDELGIITPFSSYFIRYEQMETTYLLQKLSRVLKVPASQTVPDLITQVFEVAEDAVTRCYAFSYGTNAPGLRNALEKFLQVFSRRLETMIMVTLDEGRREQEWKGLEFGLRLCILIEKRLRRLEMILIRRYEVSVPAKGIPASLLRMWKLAGGADVPRDGPASPPPVTDPRISALPKSRDCIRDVARVCQKFTYQYLFQPIESALSVFSNTTLWQPAETNSKSRASNSSVSGAQLAETPTFSLSPSKYITDIGEHLLTLPQVLEFHFAAAAAATELGGDDAKATLSFLTQDLPHIQVMVRDSLCLPPCLAGPPSASSSSSNSDLALQSDQEDLSASFTRLWIRSLSTGLQSSLLRYIFQMSPLPLSSSGRNQLSSADLPYLKNILNAVDVPLVWELRVLEKVLRVGPGPGFQEWAASEEWMEKYGEERVLKDVTGFEGSAREWTRELARQLGRVVGWTTAEESSA